MYHHLFAFSRINPVTGCIRPEPSGPSPLDGMSEEQKEYEAMKLVNAMNKLMKTGWFSPFPVRVYTFTSTSFSRTEC